MADVCKVCGNQFSNASYGGPGICPACDCGIPPKQKESFAQEMMRGSFMTLWQNYCSQKEEIAQLRGTLSLAEEGLANYEEENQRLRAALKGLSDMYARTWDRVDGALVMMPDRVDLFEEAHAAARIALGEPLDGDIEPAPQSAEHKA